MDSYITLGKPNHTYFYCMNDRNSLGIHTEFLCRKLKE